MECRSPHESLLRDPHLFAFDAAYRMLAHLMAAEPDAALRFASPPHLGYQASEILAITEDGGRRRVITSLIGLAGPAGALPRPYTEAVTVAARNRSTSLADFLDMLASRLAEAYARAGVKYRHARASEHAALEGRDDPIGAILVALAGYAEAGDATRLTAGPAALQHYAGFFAMRPRSADRLAALASDWLGRLVRVRQFSGAWLAIPRSERTSLPRGRFAGSFAVLGSTAVAGVRAWSAQSGIMLVVGPLTRPEFEALLPGTPRLAEFLSLVRAFAGLELEVSVNLVLHREAVPPLRLPAGGFPAPRLGWTSWLTAPARARRADPADAVFDAASIEAAA